MASPRGLLVPSASAALIVLLCPRLVSSRIGMPALTGKTFKEFLDSNPQALVDFYSPEDGDWPRRRLELDEVVRGLRGKGCQLPVAKVDIVADTDLLEKYVPTGHHPRLVFFRNGEATKYFTNSRSPSRMVEFAMAMHRKPVMIVEEAAGCRPHRGVLGQVPLSSDLFKAFQEVAWNHKTSLLFCAMEHTGGRIQFLKEGDAVGAEYGGGAAVPQLDAWVHDSLVGARRSEPLPEEQWHEGSLQVVGRNFDKLVLRSNKDSVILIYAPWCGYSKRFFPIWQAFAKAAHDPRLVVAKMNGDQNEGVEGFTWEGYPTVFMFRAGETEAIEYTGGNTVEELTDFVDQHRTPPDKFPVSAETDGSELEL